MTTPPTPPADPPRSAPRAPLAPAHADPLTGLANRLWFMERLEVLVSRRRTTDAPPFAVLVLDVDRFAMVNARLGRAAGDLLLVETANRLERVLRSTDVVARFQGEHTLARMGGDEFTVLLHGVKTSEDVHAIAERLRAAIGLPVALEGRDVVLSVSVGVVTSASRHRRAEDVVRDATTAMDRARLAGDARPVASPLDHSRAGVLDSRT